jgi:hypothetical protein
MRDTDDINQDSATPEECLRKAASLRLMARMLDQGRSRDSALALAEKWERKARGQPAQDDSHG